MFDELLSNLIGADRPTEPKSVVLGERETMPMATSACTGCGICADRCRSKAISVDDGWKVDLGRCVLCMDCVSECPGGCIGERPAPDYALSRSELVVGPDTDIEMLERPLDPSARRMFGRSVALRELDTGSCNGCEVELNCMSNRFYDMHRFGIKVVASPRHADGLLVTGPMCANMREAAERTYGAVPEPKMIIAVGACAISGGPFVGGDVAEDGIESVLKPAILVPGCPPSPDRVIRSLVKALGLR